MYIRTALKGHTSNHISFGGDAATSFGFQKYICASTCSCGTLMGKNSCILRCVVLLISVADVPTMNFRKVEL